jgi:hypothetical protein
MIKNFYTGNNQVSSSGKQIAVLIGVMLLISIYAIARYQGMWGETDTASFAQSMRAISAEGTLAPKNSLYSNGYGYPVLGQWISQLSGLSISKVQLFIAILMAPWIIMPAWLFFREITVSPYAATLATMILLIQPEFLFPMLRGTHEKFTRGLMMICLYLLVRSLRIKSNLHRLLSFTLTFYICAAGLITYNVFLATSLIGALAFALIFCWLGSRWMGSTSPIETFHLKNIGYKILGLCIIVFIFMFYVYPPTQDNIRIFSSMADRLWALILGLEPIASNPYNVIYQGWLNTPIYILLTLPNWLLLFCSMAFWLMKTWGIIRRKFSGGLADFLLWALFTAFAVQGLLSIALDFSGTLAANLQHRVFPSFAMLAAPLVAKWILDRRISFNNSSKFYRFGLPLGISLLAMLAILKATSEPLLSNKWTYYSTGEAQAVQWADQVLSGRRLWTGFDERVNVAVIIRQDAERLNIQLDQYDREPETRNLLLSSITRQRSLRLKEAIPVKPDDFITYDNGSTQIYHLRPHSPFQW